MFLVQLTGSLRAYSPFTHRQKASFRSVEKWRNSVDSISVNVSCRIKHFQTFLSIHNDEAFSPAPS